MSTLNPLSFALFLSGSAAALSGGLALYGKKSDQRQHAIIFFFTLALTLYLYRTTRYIEPIEQEAPTTSTNL